MVKKIVLLILCLTAIASYSQSGNGTVSPYSFGGIGDFRPQTTIENQAMGGLSMYTDSIHVNLNNPAAYGKLRLVTYTAGGGHKEVKLKDFTDKESSSVTTLEYIALAFPISPKFGIGFGVLPYTAVGYNVFSQTTNVTQDTVVNQFTGDGGLNKLFLSAGYEITKNLHVGATVNYSFGNIEYQSVQSIEGVQYGTINIRESEISGYDFNYGATYTPRIKNKYTLFSSVTVNTQANLVSSNTERLGSFSLSTGEEIEVRDVNLEPSNLRNTELKIPTRTTFGLGLGRDKKWFIGAEYSLQAVSSFRNDFIDPENIAYEDANTLRVGGYYVPDYASFTSYLKRITYRAGARTSKTGLIVNDTSIHDFGITFGLGLPVGGGFSNMNIGFEYGKRGTTVANLIEETYFKVSVGLSFNDKWFQKRKIN
ncbi:hypothetical protein [Eudoraea sp.]|uniref:hypothetical protein n=2 Tax=Eudoraea sp. TaxID=1979955 RepID=UPI003C758EA6